jgi:hypothetical protein
MSTHRTQPVPASDIYAMQLIDEALRQLVRRYAPPQVMKTAAAHVDESLGRESVTTTQRNSFEFPGKCIAGTKGGRVSAEAHRWALRPSKNNHVFTHNANPS